MEALENPNTLYASLARRILAFLLDWMILAIPVAIGVHIIPLLGGVVVWFFYAPMMESSRIRATLGKHLVGIQVTDPTGRRISLKAAMIRNVLKVISTVLLFIGFFFALFTRKKQALHDLLADTQVVYGRDDQSVIDAWVANVKDVFTAEGSAPVKVGDGGFESPPQQSPQQSPHDRSTQERSTLAQLAPRPLDADSIAAQIERLKALRDNGTLTEEEFQQAKRKALDS